MIHYFQGSKFGFLAKFGGSFLEGKKLLQCRESLGIVKLLLASDSLPQKVGIVFLVSQGFGCCETERESQAEVLFSEGDDNRLVMDQRGTAVLVMCVEGLPLTPIAGSCLFSRHAGPVVGKNVWNGVCHSLSRTKELSYGCAWVGHPRMVKGQT